MRDKDGLWTKVLKILKSQYKKTIKEIGVPLNYVYLKTIRRDYRQQVSDFTKNSMRNY